MKSSLVPDIHDILLRLGASFIYDQVQAMVKVSRKTYHDT
jgi:hypothetical protein